MIPFKITKEEVNALPLGQFEGDIFLIDKIEDVEEVAEFLIQQRVIGFDTETKPAFTKGVTNQVSLLQLSTSTQAFLFRLNEIGFRNQSEISLKKKVL